MRQGRQKFLPQLIKRVLVLAVLVALGAGWHYVRTDAVLGSPVQRQLDQLGDRMAATFAFDTIRPAGLLGVSIEGLTLETANGDRIAFGPVVVQPNLASILSGDLRIGELEVASVSFTSDRSLDQLVETLSLLTSLLRVTGTTTGPSGSGTFAVLPDVITIRAGDIALSAPGHGLRPIQVELEDILIHLSRDRTDTRVSVDGTYHLAGLTSGTASLQWVSGGDVIASLTADHLGNWLDLLDEVPAHLVGVGVSLTGLDVSSAHEVTLQQLQVWGLSEALPRLPEWQVMGVTAASSQLQWSHEGLALDLEDASVQLQGLFEENTVHIAELHAWSDWSLSYPEGEVRLGGPDLGSLTLSFERSAYNDTLSVTAIARAYELTELAELGRHRLAARPLGGRVSGEVSLSLPLDQAQPVVMVSLDIALEGGSAEVPVLSTHILEDIELSLSGELTMDFGTNEFTWDDGRAVVQGTPWLFDAFVDWDEQLPRLELTATCSHIEAETLRRSLPRGLVPALEGMTLGGALSAFIHLDLDTANPDDAEVVFEADLSNVQVTRFSEAAPLDILGDETFAVGIATTSDRTVGPGTDSWIRLTEAGEYTAGALVSAEDGGFWRHDGIDWSAIRSAVRQNLREQRFARGGSTISQQVVRSFFLGNDRTLGRKLEEAFLTWQLEQLVDKDRIMELYLNVVHWGPGVYGIGDAADAYFQRAPADLTVREAAFLASILPNPEMFGAQYARDTLSPGRRSKICRVLFNMHRSGDISEHSWDRNCRAARDGFISNQPRPVELFQTTMVERDDADEALAASHR